MIIKQATQKDRIEILDSRLQLQKLRDYYPEFQHWFDTKVVPSLDKTRFLYVAYDGDEWVGAMILKDGKNRYLGLPEKKICTLFVKPEYQFNHVGGDFLSIASQKLRSNNLPITVSGDVKKDFFNNPLFNYVILKEVQNCYLQGRTEYIGYIRYHENSTFLRLIKKSKGKIVIDSISFFLKNDKETKKLFKKIEKELTAKKITYRKQHF